MPLFREGRIGRVFLRYGVTATRDKKKDPSFRRWSHSCRASRRTGRSAPSRPWRRRACASTGALPSPCSTAPAPAAVAGYAVYRRDAGDEEYEDRPLGVVIGTTTFVDATVVPDRKYVYTVRAAPVAELPLILGPASDEVPVSTADVFPPAAPDGVLILAEATAHASCGTRASRATSPPIAFTAARTARGRRIADDLKDPVYFDAGFSASEYAVTAVDKSGNESAMGRAK